MRAGRRNHKIVIEEKSVTPDAYGDPVETWTQFAEAWVENAPESGREFLAAKQERADLSRILTTRYIDGISPDMRVVDGERVFDIISAFDPSGRRRELKIHCREQL